MHLDRVLRGAETVCGDLVQSSGYDMLEYFALARRELCKACSACRGRLRRSLLRICAIHRRTNRTHEVNLPDRLGEKVHCAGLDRSYAHRNIAVPGEKYDRQRCHTARQTLLQLEPVNPWHRNVEQDASNVGLRQASKKISGRTETFDIEPFQFQEALECTQQVRLVVDQKYLSSGGHFASAISGKLTWNVEPLPSFASAHSRPPCADTIDREIASPNPRPSVLVV